MDNAVSPTNFARQLTQPQETAWAATPDILSATEFVQYLRTFNAKPLLITYVLHVTLVTTSTMEPVYLLTLFARQLTQPQETAWAATPVILSATEFVQYLRTFTAKPLLITHAQHVTLVTTSKTESVYSLTLFARQLTQPQETAWAATPDILLATEFVQYLRTFTAKP
jgi:hypothetical protein